MHCQLTSICSPVEQAYAQISGIEDGLQMAQKFTCYKFQEKGNIINYILLEFVVMEMAYCVNVAIINLVSFKRFHKWTNFAGKLESEFEAINFEHIFLVVY